MKKCGFTLVELIITIAIMGIIMMIAFPSVTRLSQTNKYKKAVSYGESMVAAAKLYVDQYSEDLWGNMNATGARDISMAMLKNKDLFKNYTDKKDVCNTGSVRVVRSGTKNNFSYTYEYSLTCTLTKKNVTCTGDSNTSRCVEGGRTVYNSNS